MRIGLSYFLLALLTFSLISNTAFAARFGGGRSIGVQRSSSSFYSNYKTPRHNYYNQTNRTRNPNRWGSLLSGLVMGGLLASLFMNNGLGAGLFSWLAIGLLAFLIFNFLKKRNQFAYANQATNNYRDSLRFAANFPYNVSSKAMLANFDAEAFLRTAKVTFIRLQAAYDQKNIQDIREFTTPEVYAEIKMQLDERVEQLNKTAVINLEAELLDVSEQVHDTIASVRFTGFIKENEQPMVNFNEIWHFRRFAATNNWLVAGLQPE